jgi:fibronectin-binding autotransporter adhesin
MLAKGNRFHFVRGKSTSRRTMFLACGAIANAAVFSFMTPHAHGQTFSTWTSSISGNWSNGANWLGGSPPPVSSSGDANLEFDAAGSYTSNNDLGKFGVFNTTFDAGNGTTNLTGGEIDLSNPASEPNNPVFTNNSTNPVTINDNVVFSENVSNPTPETFALAQGSSTTFNGSMTLTGGSAIVMTNGMAPGASPTGGTMIWTQPVAFTNSPNSPYSGYFAIRIKEGTFEMGGYTIDDGVSDAPIINVNGVNAFPATPTGVNNGASTDVFIGPDDLPASGPSLDVASFYLLAGGQSFNSRVEMGNAGTVTVGGLNTSGTVTFNNFFNTVNQNGVGQTVYYSAAAGGTVLQNFQLIGGSQASIDKIGPGTWIIGAGGINPSASDGLAYSGNTTVRDGTLELSYDDYATTMVNFPASGLPSYYVSGDDGGSLGFNAATNAVQLGDSGTLATDNIALLTLLSASGPTRLVLHNISVNNFNPSGTTSVGVGDNGIGNFQGNIALSKSVVLASGTGGTANFSGAITGGGGIGTSGTGTVNLSAVNGYTGSTAVSSGSTLDAMVTGALPTGTHVTNNGALIVNGNSTLGSLTGTGTLSISPASGSNKVTLATNSGQSTEGGLTIANNSTLDITNNHMIITYAAGTQATVDSTIRGYLISGYAGGLWNGATGIESSAAAANSGFAVGYADGADGIVAGLSSGQLELKYTRYGDANLDGVVSGDDFSILVGNLGKSVSGWDKGDFNYDGVVSGDDFSLLVGNLGKAANGADITLPASDLAAIDAFAAANGLMADVPEPASAGLLLAAGLGFMGRRRRSSDRHVAM